MQEIAQIEGLDRWEAAIQAWGKSKLNRSGSSATHAAYIDTLHKFRAALHAGGLELDADIRAIAVFLETWAHAATRPEKKGLAATSSNRRLSIVSSFYKYAIKLDMVEANPVARVDRSPVDEYAGAVALNMKVLKAKLFAIDTSTPLGVRDLALLLLAVMTGRRVSELRNLSTGDIIPVNDRALIIWPHTKGGKTMRDEVEPFVAEHVFAHLLCQYGADWQNMPKDTPVWVSHSPHGHGERLSIWGIAGVYEHRLGITKVHASRHTFAHMMDELGASASEIQRRLGHSSLATTDRYLKKLASPANPRGKEMGKLIGFGEKEK